VAYAALAELARKGRYPRKDLPKALRELGIDPDAPDPATA
jgi:pyruvate dehydrogenase complex dehydrogenase (E1) component